MAHFQIKLGDDWKDFSSEEDKSLRTAFEAGRKKSIFGGGRKKSILTLRGQRYEFDFKEMKQKNLSTGKVREIRPPRCSGSRPVVQSSASSAETFHRPGDRKRSSTVPVDAILLPETAVTFVPATPHAFPSLGVGADRPADTSGPGGASEVPSLPSAPPTHEQLPSIPKAMTLQALRGFGDPAEVSIGAAPLVAPPVLLGSRLMPSAPPPTKSCSMFRKPSVQAEAGVILDLF